AHDRQAEWTRPPTLRDRLQRGIPARVTEVLIKGKQSERTPNTSKLPFDYIKEETLVIALDPRSFAVSSGAACSSGAVEPSHVLLAIGLPPERARASIRFSLGRSNTAEQVDALIDAVAESVKHLRKISPVVPAHA